MMVLYALRPWKLRIGMDCEEKGGWVMGQFVAHTTVYNKVKFMNKEKKYSTGSIVE